MGEGHIWSQSILGKLKSPATQILQLSLRALDSDFENSSQLRWSCSYGLRDYASCLAAVLQNNKAVSYNIYIVLYIYINFNNKCILLNA